MSFCATDEGTTGSAGTGRGGVTGIGFGCTGGGIELVRGGNDGSVMCVWCDSLAGGCVVAGCEEG